MSDRPTISRRRMLGLLAAGSALAACGERRGARARAAHARAARQGRGRLAAVRAERRVRHRPQARLGPLAAAEPGACSATTSPTSSPPTRAPPRRPPRPPSRSCCRPTRSTSWSGSSTTPPRSPSSRSWTRPRSCCSSRVRAPRTSRRRPATPTSGARPSATRSWRRRWARSWPSPTPRDGVYIVAPSDDQGTATIAGFQVAFESAGGRVAGTARLAPGAAPQRTITLIQRAKPKATYCALAPADAAAFIKAYAQAGLAADDPAVRLGPDHRRRRAHPGGPGRGRASRPRCTTPTSSPPRRTPRSSPPTRPPTRTRRAASRCRATTPRACSTRALGEDVQAARRRHASPTRWARAPTTTARAAGGSSTSRARCRTSTCARCRTRAARWSTPSCSTSAWRASRTR